MKISKSEISEFLKQWCDEVYDMPFHHLELMMDNHRCIRWYGREYFMQEDNSFWSSYEGAIAEHLYDNFQL